MNFNVGHGGSGAAIYAGKHMVRILEESEAYKQYVSLQDPSKIDLLGEGLRQAFLSADEQLRAYQDEETSDHSGCTAVVACVTPNYIICANAGDSRCVMGTGGGTKPLSEDHKPTDEGERKRIEDAGGSVSWKRVDGDLAVSRALGDFQYKRRGDLIAEQQKVVAIAWSDISLSFFLK